MLYVLWFSGIHRHGQNALQGWCVLAFALPLCALLMFLVESVLIYFYASHPQLLDVLTVVGEMRLYDDGLFKIWQLWSYIFFHEHFLHLFLNACFLLPLAMFWERLLGVWFLLALLLIIPASVTVFLITGFMPGDVGLSSLVMGLFGALLLRGEHRQAEYRFLQWLGTRMTVRIFVKPLWWACAVFVLVDLLRFALKAESFSVFGVYVAHLLIAAGVGASAFSIIQQLRRLLLAPATA